MAASAFRFQGLSTRFFGNIQHVVGSKGDGLMLTVVVPRRTIYSTAILQGQTNSKGEDGLNTDRRLQKIIRQELEDPLHRVHRGEKFIPITRRSVVRHMVSEKSFLNSHEQKLYDQLAERLDSAVVNRYHGLLQELKILFDPINPDKDTITTRTLNRKERLDSEFWLVNRLAHVMNKANFTELSSKDIDKAMSEHKAREGVLVSVNVDNYDILRIWSLGRDQEVKSVSSYRRWIEKLLKKQAASPLEFYKRVVIAIRLKRDDKLILKAFKDVPIDALEQLLPDGKIKMTKLDSVLIQTSVALGVLGIVAKFFTYLAQVYVQWTLIVTGVTALTAVRVWTVYKNRHHAYMRDLNRMLYFKNIANNRGLLTLLVDRAEDELFKEALLVYTFLLTNRSPSVGSESSDNQTAYELGNLNRHELEQRIEDWVYKKTKINVQFDSTDAVQLLAELGLLRANDSDTSLVGSADSLVVLPLDAAIRNLPVSNQAKIERDEESDIVEGYDKQAFDTGFIDEEKKRLKYGWV